MDVEAFLLAVEYRKTAAFAPVEQADIIIQKYISKIDAPYAMKKKCLTGDKSSLKLFDEIASFVRRA